MRRFLRRTPMQRARRLCCQNSTHRHIAAATAKRITRAVTRVPATTRCRAIAANIFHRANVAETFCTCFRSTDSCKQTLWRHCMPTRSIHLFQIVTMAAFRTRDTTRHCAAASRLDSLVNWYHVDNTTTVLSLHLYFCRLIAVPSATLWRCKSIRRVNSLYLSCASFC